MRLSVIFIHNCNVVKYFFLFFIHPVNTVSDYYREFICNAGSYETRLGTGYASRWLFHPDAQTFTC